MYKNAHKLLLVPFILVVATPLPSCAHYVGQKGHTKSAAKVKPQKPYGGSQNAGRILKALRKTLGYDSGSNKTTHTMEEKVEQVGTNKAAEPVKVKHNKIAVTKPASRIKPVKPYSMHAKKPEKAVDKGGNYKHTPRKPMRPYNNGHIRTEKNNKSFWENLLGF